MFPFCFIMTSIFAYLLYYGILLVGFIVKNREYMQRVFDSLFSNTSRSVSTNIYNNTI